ncbi:MAG TPA: helix-turn-helix domain-containing protein [Polyangiaceae bacterium]|nr:helix-turn-helix domain-containing protein [Polyangiaceae bacterium]
MPPQKNLTLDRTFRLRFGERLRRLRERKQLSQLELSQTIPIEPRVISRYERGVTLPRADTLVLLARVLDVSVGKLLLGEEDDERAIAAAKIRDGALLDRFRELDQLSANDRMIVAHVIDAFLAQHACDHITHRPRRNGVR